MADEVAVGGAGSGAAAGGSSGGAGGGSSSPGVGGTSMTEAQISAPGGDIAFLNAEPEAPKDKGTADSQTTDGKSADAAKSGEEGTEEVNLSALEEGQPEWLAKVTDPAAKAEVEKLLGLNKQFLEHFKDGEDLANFFKELPGGREQIDAMKNLVADVDQLDSALEANTPEGNLEVAARYLEMTPDGGAGLLRAAAQHMAKANPEAWNQISSELINSTLHAAGFGFDMPTLVGAIRDIKAAIAADDGEAWGAATGKLLGAPKAAAQPDAKTQASEREAAAKADAVKAQTEVWQTRSTRSGENIDKHISTGITAALGKVLPATVSAKDRDALAADIATEVSSQLFSDAWLGSKVGQLIGMSRKGEKGQDYSKAILKASQADWDAATKLVTDRATPALIAKAAAKVVSKWSKDRAASNKEARDKARGAATTVDVGAAKAAAGGNGRKVLSPEQMRARNERGDFVISDRDFLNS